MHRHAPASGHVGQTTAHRVGAAAALDIAGVGHHRGKDLAPAPRDEQPHVADAGDEALGRPAAGPVEHAQIPQLLVGGALRAADELAEPVGQRQAQLEEAHPRLAVLRDQPARQPGIGLHRLGGPGDGAVVVRHEAEVHQQPVEAGGLVSGADRVLVGEDQS